MMANQEERAVLLPGDGAAATAATRRCGRGAPLTAATYVLALAKRVNERTMRGGERQSTEPLGHRIRAPCLEQSVQSI